MFEHKTKTIYSSETILALLEDLKGLIGEGTYG